ncbi:PaaI family thioesterase [Bradyrhizobium sp. 18BD]
MTSTDIPAGFEPLFRKSPLTEPWEPLYSRNTDKAVIIGLRLARPHTNGRGLIHGGLIAALADNAMGHSCALVTNWTTSFVTVSLSVDFVGSAEIGQWCSIESDVIKTGKTICFAQCLIKADDVVIARASGTFRVVPKPTQTSTPPSPPRDR